MAWQVLAIIVAVPLALFLMWLGAKDLIERWRELGPIGKNGFKLAGFAFVCWCVFMYSTEDREQARIDREFFETLDNWK